MEQKIWKLQIGSWGKIKNVEDNGRGIGTRLHELGFVEGDMVMPALRSPFGDPIAYQIRGALIALRREDADLITVETIEPEDMGI